MWPLIIAFDILKLVFAFFVIWAIISRFDDGAKKVCVVVLGDIGRSPRMQYHALSFAKEGFIVDLIGYGGSRPHEDLRCNQKIIRHCMRQSPQVFTKLPSIGGYICKVLWQCLTLFWSFVQTKRHKFILIQNPPSIPTIAVAWFISLLRGSTLVIDWHNYGYTILELSLGPNHPLVPIARWYEHLFGRGSTHNICVTKAMKEDLGKNWDISAVTMYDRPPDKFKTTEIDEKHKLFVKLADVYSEFKDRDDNDGKTAFTELDDDGEPQLRSKRPALLVSSTSWTEDEDFSILLHALDMYEAQLSADDEQNLPDLICAITGKGPKKAYYKAVIDERQWRHVQVCTPWLEAEDYPSLLGCADVGVCLHMSSSGLDLPMKVVDMFGCGLPVCAIHFNCLDELVKHDVNGLVFHTEKELAQQLQDLLCNFPHSQKKLQQFQENLKTFQAIRWDDCWKRTVLPLLGEDNEQEDQ